MFRDKKGMSVSIVLLVVLTLALSIFLLASFSHQSGKTSEDFGNYLYLEEFNHNVQILNFNLKKSLDVAFENGDFESGLDNRIELMENIFDDFNFVVLSRDIDFDDKGYEATLDIMISLKKEGFGADYKYTKTFINK